MTTTTWNSEPLFTAFACSEADEGVIVETAEEGFTVVLADDGKARPAADLATEIFELGNVVEFVPARAVRGGGAARGSDKNRRWLDQALDAMQPKKRAAQFTVPLIEFNELQGVAAATAWARRSAGMPLFLAA